MRTAKHRRGMTLIELMISASIMSIVLAAVVSAFITTQRMLKDAMGLSELSLAARELREKLLFNATPYSSGTRYAGLLTCKGDGSSGEPLDSSGNITMRAPAITSSLADVTSTPAQVKIELATSSDGKKRYLFNSKPAGSTSARWFWPIGTSILNTSMSEIISYDTAGVINSSSFTSTSSQNAIRINLDIVLTSDAKNPDGSPMTRRERIVVPIFGVVQPYKVTRNNKEYY